MDRRTNPFAPGAGLQPPELAGRDSLIADARIDMERIKDGRPSRSIMLLGLRGVGKTVLLNRLHNIADELEFQTIKIEAPEGGTLPELIVPELRRILYKLDIKEAATQTVRRAFSSLRNFIAAFKVNVGDVEFGLEPSPGVADTGLIEQDLPSLLIAVSQVAKERGTALGLFIDEIQYLAPKELGAVIVSCHQAAQQGLPLFLVAAGLPQIAALSGNAKSYAERLFSYPQVDKLTDDAATKAIKAPVEREDVRFKQDAIADIIERTQKYPYFIQEWGFHVWNYAKKSPISLNDVRDASPSIIKHLDENFFRVRFDRLTALQQKYLRAMAELGPGPHKTGDVANMLGVLANTIAPVRQQLIVKGMVWSQRHGETAFTVPLFDEFMMRQMPELEQHVPRRRAEK
jgi:hypothetical protein